MVLLFNTLIYEPLLNTLVFLYNTVAFEDLGLSIIFLTLFIRVLFYPFFRRSLEHQQKMQKLQPEVKKLQHKHKDAPEKQMKAISALYKENNLNPFSGFLFLLVQLPVIIAVYRIALNALDPTILDGVYSFISRPEALNNTFLGLLDLRERSIVVVFVAALLQYIQGRMSTAAQGGGTTPGASIGKKMVVIGPIITVVILVNLPAAVGLYWLASTLVSIIQQAVITKKAQPTHGMGTVYNTTRGVDGIQ